MTAHFQVIVIELANEISFMDAKMIAPKTDPNPPVMIAKSALSISFI